MERRRGVCKGGKREKEREKEIERDFFKADQAGLCRLSYCVDLRRHLLYITFRADNIIARPDK